MEPSAWTVFLAAMATAIMTGAGALPFFFFSQIRVGWLGYANAVAGGLMLAASHGLLAEGAALNPERVLIGVVIGLTAIVVANHFIEQADHVSFAELGGKDARKALMILGIMTAHSFAEGIGVGVSFGGTDALSTFITTAIALHNIPEGLAISLVLIPRGLAAWKAAGWSIFSSLPQPLMAVPAFLFVQAFQPFLPIGLGIAAGAMIWMVFSDILPDALAKAPAASVGTVMTVAFTAMMAFQMLVLK